MEKQQVSAWVSLALPAPEPESWLLAVSDVELSFAIRVCCGDSGIKDFAAFPQAADRLFGWVDDRWKRSALFRLRRWRIGTKKGTNGFADILVHCLYLLNSDLAAWNRALRRWYARKESNLHARRHRNLNPARLPIPPRARPAVALGQRRRHTASPAPTRSTPNPPLGQALGKTYVRFVREIGLKAAASLSAAVPAVSIGTKAVRSKALQDSWTIESWRELKHLLLTTIAVGLVVVCVESQQSSSPASTKLTKTVWDSLRNGRDDGIFIVSYDKLLGFWSHRGFDSFYS